MKHLKVFFSQYQHLLLPFLFMTCLVPCFFLSFYNSLLFGFSQIVFIFLGTYTLIKTKCYSMQPIIVFLLLLCVAAFTSCLNSIYIQRSIESALFFFCTISIVSYIASHSTQKKNYLLAILLGFTFVSCIWGIIQYFWGFEYIKTILPSQLNYLSKETIINHKRIFSFLKNPNAFASFLILCIPVIIGLLIQAKQLLRKYLWGFFLFICISCLLLTKSICAIIICFFAFVVTTIFFYRKNKISNSLLSILLLSTTIITICTFFIINQRIQEISFLQKITLLSTHRILFWKTSLFAICKNPFSALGIGTYGIIYPLYKIASAPETQFAHNIIFQMWIEMGTLSVLLLIGFGGSLLYLLKNLFIKAQDNIVKIGITIGCISFLVHNLTDFTFYLPQNAILFWCFIGLIIPATTTKKSQLLIKKIFPIILRPTLIFLCLISFLFTIQFGIAKTLHRKSLKALHKQDTVSALLLNSNACKINPTNSTYHIYQAKLADKTGDQSMVINAYKNAISHNLCYYKNYLDLGYHYFRTKQFNKCLEQLAQAKRCYPTSPLIEKALIAIHSSTQYPFYFPYTSNLSQPKQFLDRNTIEIKQGKTTYYKIFIPYSGKYYLYGYFYQNEKSTWPIISLTAEMENKSPHTDYIFYEPTWYLQNNEKGRWLHHSFGGTKPWKLEPGILTLSFKLEGNKTNWVSQKKALEQNIYLDHLVVIPVQLNSSGKDTSMTIIEMDGFQGNWDIINYSSELGTGIATTHKQNSSIQKTIHFPSKDSYTGYISILAKKGGKIRINTEEIMIQPSPTWQIATLHNIQIDTTKEKISITNQTNDDTEISIDYILFLPTC